jgi:hypothetical protein
MSEPIRSFTTAVPYWRPRITPPEMQLCVGWLHGVPGCGFLVGVGTEIAGVLDRLKLLVRMKGNREVVSLLVTTGSSCSLGATLPDVGITRTSYLSNASSTCCRSIVLNF